MNRFLVPAAALFFTATLAGCQHYYRVREPSGTKTYYTDHITETGGGAIKFTDLESGSKVTLQASEVADVPKEEVPGDVLKK